MSVLATLLISQNMERAIESETIEYIIFIKNKSPLYRTLQVFGYYLRSPMRVGHWAVRASCFRHQDG